MKGLTKMFKGFKEWWKWFTVFDPAKLTNNMTDKQCMDELKVLWDKYRVFDLFTTQAEYARIELLRDVLDKRGYNIYGSVVGMSFEKRSK